MFIRQQRLNFVFFACMRKRQVVNIADANNGIAMALNIVDRAGNG